jgi:hypothetical protein
VSTIVNDLRDALRTAVPQLSNVVRDEARFEGELAMPYASIFDGVTWDAVLVGDSQTIGYQGGTQIDLWQQPGPAAADIEAAAWRAIDGLKLDSGRLRARVVSVLRPGDEQDIIHTAITVRYAALR